MSYSDFKKSSKRYDNFAQTVTCNENQTRIKIGTRENKILL